MAGMMLDRENSTTAAAGGGVRLGIDCHSMQTRLILDIQPQPDETTCGPTCLQAVYRYYDDDLPLEQVIEEHRQLREGGTLAVFLACHALRRGYKATIYTYNLEVFDPSWFVPEPKDLRERLAGEVGESHTGIEGIGVGRAKRHGNLRATGYAEPPRAGVHLARPDAAPGRRGVPQLLEQRAGDR